MKNKKIITTWSRALTQIFDSQAASDRQKTLARVQAVLVQKKKDYLLPKILEAVINDIQKRDRLEIVFAREQDKETVEKIRLKLAAVGKGKEVAARIDEAIIGGFVAKTRDYIVNASIKDYLDQLKRRYGA